MLWCYAASALMSCLETAGCILLWAKRTVEAFGRGRMPSFCMDVANDYLLCPLYKATVRHETFLDMMGVGGINYKV